MLTATIASRVIVVVSRRHLLVCNHRSDDKTHDHNMWDFSWLNINWFIHRIYILIDEHTFQVADLFLISRRCSTNLAVEKADYPFFKEP